MQGSGRGIAMALAVLLLTGCAAKKWQPYRTEQTSSNHYPALWVGKSASNPRLAPGVGRLVTEFAIFSANAYQPEEEKDYFGRPAGWSMAAWQEGKTQMRDKGLAYRVYEGVRPDGTKRVVFAFRGTEFFSQDWLSNLGIYYALGMRDQYLLARQEVESVLTAHYPGAPCGAGYEFYATGHSLGGGLASSIALSFPCFTVINFNQSMVKAINRMSEPYRGAPFFHVHEEGEPLDHPRKFFDYGDVRYTRVDLTPVSNPLSNHNMVNMVLGLISCDMDPPDDLKKIYVDYMKRNEKKDLGRWLLDVDIKRSFVGCPAQTWDELDVANSGV